MDSIIRPGCLIKASRIWNWDSTGSLIEIFLERYRFPWFSCTEALKTWDKPGCWTEPFGKSSNKDF